MSKDSKKPFGYILLPSALCFQYGNDSETHFFNTKFTLKKISLNT